MSPACFGITTHSCMKPQSAPWLLSLPTGRRRRLGEGSKLSCLGGSEPQASVGFTPFFIPYSLCFNMGKVGQQDLTRKLIPTSLWPMRFIASIPGQQCVSDRLSSFLCLLENLPQAVFSLVCTDGGGGV